MILLYGFVIILFSTSVLPDTIFKEDFNSGYAGWSTSGTVDPTSTDCHTACDAVRLTQDGMIWRAIDTSGYTSVTFAWAMAASSLEAPDFCYAEVPLPPTATTVCRD